MAPGSNHPGRIVRGYNDSDHPEPTKHNGRTAFTTRSTGQSDPRSEVSKLITMVDELHRVHPDLENGTDPQVEALKKTVDPHQSIKTLNQLLDEEE